MNESRIVSTLRTLLHVAVLRPLVRLFFGINIIGGENIRGLERYIVIANHNSHLDSLLLFCLLPLRDIARTHPVADGVYFSASRIVFRCVTFLFRPIWIERGHPRRDKDPFQDIKSRIDAGHNVIIFPEGTRGEPGELQHFKSGIGRLLTQFPDVPVVPVFLTGPERALPKSSFLLLPFWNNIIVGPPQVCRGGHRDITQTLESILVGLSHSEPAQRQKRKPLERKPARTICVLGIDGSGKSTISRMVAESLSTSSKVCRVGDGLEFLEDGSPRDIQPLLTEKLRELIGGYAKKAKSLKFYKIPKLTELLLRNHLMREARRWYLPDFIVVDGSPLLNIAAWAVLYKKDVYDDAMCTKVLHVLSGDAGAVDRNDPVFVHCPELAYLDRMKLARLSMPDAVLFLDLPPSAACQRIGARGEERQPHETEEKLGDLRGAYQTVCEIVRREGQVPVLAIDAEKEPETIASEGLAFIRDALKVDG